MTPMLTALCLVVALAGPAMPARAADSAQSLYTAALARERGVRADASKPSLRELRSVVAAYEAIVRRYPRSGYSDNALWQGGNLALLAFERYGESADKRRAIRLLEQLRDHYPSSSLMPRVRETIRQAEATRPPAPPPVVKAAAKPAPASVVAIRDITRTVLPDGVRVSIEMERESAYRAERLEGPARVFFDLKGTQPVPDLLDATLTFEDEVVREIRLGRHPDSTTRIVMDMEGVENYSVFTLYEPFRIVVDFTKAPATRPTAGVAATSGPAPAPAKERPPAAPLEKLVSKPPVLTPPAPPSANASGSFSIARQLGLGISRIVIDAGHGGHDPGTQGNGVKEAELVLDVAQRLAKLLRKQNFEVVMTRDSDVFIPLEERGPIANREGADLFISIHANAARNREARGVETYFLNFATTPEAEAVAARENSGSGRKMHNLPDIVRAIALNNKIDESRDFASTVQRAMVERLGERNKQLRNRGVKQAPFVVLIGAAMPAVLAEVSFLTNKQEAQLLKTGTYRQQIAQALLDGIVRYQQSLKKMRSASTTVGAR